MLHHTADDYDRSLTTLTQGPVSVHYLVPAPRGAGALTVLQLVDESRRVWHAGKSYWRGRTHLNDTAISIEIENDGYRHSADGSLRWAPWPPQQIAVVTALCLWGGNHFWTLKLNDKLAGSPLMARLTEIL
ncbi:MAG: N-acetylmuramoyl-L-alanine amidase [Sodalis sp. (in: enterobacteria)]|uniref:N-acetylmuramoyl-L-alanine amidase n=1 Tax=Sodalis sp. (in: enterobacteria) TaxID=1898979 RepID=UPI003F36FB69